MNHIKTMGMFAAVAIVLSLLLAATPASAADCHAAIEQLKVSTSNAVFENQKDLDVLLVKLSSAEAKLDLGKTGDAVQKLTDYREKVISLESQGKIAPSPDGTVTPASLVAEADAIIACIQTTG